MSSSVLRLAENIVATANAAAWGDIPKVDHVRASFQGEDGTEGYVISLRVDVLPHTVSCRLFPKNRGRIPREGGSVRARSVVPFQVEPENERRILEEHRLATIRFASGLLREADPRIGTILVQSSDIQGFPRGYLFDPPRLRRPAWEKPSLDSVPCSICGDGFGRGMPAMWAGGTLMWTHPDCWLSLHAG